MRTLICLVGFVVFGDSGNEVTLVKLNEYKLDDVIMDEGA